MPRTLGASPQDVVELLFEHGEFSQRILCAGGKKEGAALGVRAWLGSFGRRELRWLGHSRSIGIPRWHPWIDQPCDVCVHELGMGVDLVRRCCPVVRAGHRK